MESICASSVWTISFSSKKSLMIFFFLKMPRKLNCSNCSFDWSDFGGQLLLYHQPLASTRRVRSTFSSHCPLSSNQRHWLTSSMSVIFSSEFCCECWESHPGQLGPEASMLTIVLCCPSLANFFVKLLQTEFLESVTFQQIATSFFFLLQPFFVAFRPFFKYCMTIVKPTWPSK